MRRFTLVFPPNIANMDQAHAAPRYVLPFTRATLPFPKRAKFWIPPTPCPMILSLALYSDGKIEVESFIRDSVSSEASFLEEFPPGL